jgi:hypothetical protein
MTVFEITQETKKAVLGQIEAIANPAAELRAMAEDIRHNKPAGRMFIGELVRLRRAIAMSGEEDPVSIRLQP